MDEAMPLLALLFFLGGKKKPATTDPNHPANAHKCDQEGYRWSFKFKKCVMAQCPPNTVRNAQGLCIERDNPPPPPPGNDDPPWKDFPNDDVVDDYPTDGKLLKISLGSVWSGVLAKSILKNAIAQRAYNVKIDAGASHADALAFATTASHNQDNRSQLFAMILGDEWNDKGFETYGGLKYPKDLYDNCTHRTIRLLPQNDNVIAKLSTGTAPTRYMAMKTPADVGKGNAYGKAGGKLPVIWIPLIDAAHLESTGLVRGAAVDVMPQWIRDLGWYNLPAGITWGC